MTKKENFVAIREILNASGNNDFDAFIDHEIELLSKKRASSKKPTKVQIANEGLKQTILGVLGDEGVTVTEIMGMIGDGTLTNQKVSAVLRLMKDNDGTIKKEVVKGKSLFSLA